MFVQFLDFEGILSLLDDLVIEFVPSADCSVLGSREASKRMEIEAVHHQAHEIDDIAQDEGGDGRRQHGRDSHVCQDANSHNEAWEQRALRLQMMYSMELDPG